MANLTDIMRHIAIAALALVGIGFFIEAGSSALELFALT